MRVICELLNLIIYCGKHYCVILSALKLMHSGCNIVSSCRPQCGLKGLNLIIVRGYDADICKLFL